MNHLTPETLIQRSDLTAGRLFEGSMLVITSDDSMLHRFNEVGTFIWQSLEKGPKSIQEISGEIADHFSGFEQDRNRDEILLFIDSMRNKKLVSVVESHE